MRGFLEGSVGKGREDLFDHQIAMDSIFLPGSVPGTGDTEMTHLSCSLGAPSLLVEKGVKTARQIQVLEGTEVTFCLCLPGGKEGIFRRPAYGILGRNCICRGSEMGKGRLNSGRT